MGRDGAKTFVSSVLVVYGREALTSERKAAELLARRLEQRAGVRALAVDDQSYDPEGWQALVLVGHPDRHLVAAALMAGHGVRRLNLDRPGPEGYVVRQVGLADTPTIIIAGDGRGCLYGVGAFLRAVNLDRPGHVGIPHLQLSSAPAFPIRGSDLKFWQEQRGSDLAMQQWSLEQWEEQIADLALWGVNLIRRRLLHTAFDAWLDEHELMIEDGPGKSGWEMEKQINQIIHDYGLEVGISYPPNTVASAAARPQWRPTPSWPRLACPSQPLARDRILYERLQIFKEMAHIDHLYIPPLDVGGCDCENCQPWAKTYLALVRDIAMYLHRFHPEAQVWISNQGLSRQESEWLWESLAQECPDWLQVMEYGPSTAGLLDGSEQTIWEGRSIQSRYPTMGTLTRTAQETARRVPVDYTLVLGPDVTHTFQPQYGLERLDPVLLRLHTHESPFARPLGYHQVFRATAGASSGANLYSEGVYDDLNKALWAGWTWSPDLSPWDATLAYTRWWFGESAAQLITEAILLSEANWENPLPGNSQVEQVVLQLDMAEMRIPAHLQNDNWRWTMWRLRGLLDLLAQYKLDAAEETQRVVHSLLSETLLRPGELAARARNATGLLDLQQREARLGRLKEEIRELDDRLYDQVGVHLPAVANLDVELTNLGWEMLQLQKAIQVYESDAPSGTEALKQAVGMCLGYENPGPGGFYDDCGHIGRDPHFVSGHRIPAVAGLAPDNRPSANTFVAGLDQEVVFAYRRLDPGANYQVRLTLVCPRDEQEPGEPLPATHVASTTPRAVQRLYASGFLVHDDLRLPGRVAQQFTFDLPRQSYSDGSLELRFVQAIPGRMAAVSEIWLIKEQGKS
jgi:hypothetical protein